MCVVLSLCSYKHVFNGLRRVAMEGNKQYVYSMTFDPDYLCQNLEVGEAWEGKWLQGVWPVRGGGLEVGGGLGRGSVCKGCGL